MESFRKTPKQKRFERKIALLFIIIIIACFTITL